MMAQIDEQEVKQKINLLGLTQSKLENFVLTLGEKKFRARQIMKWLYHDGIEKIDLMSNIGKKLQILLQEEAQVKLPKIVNQSISSDGTYKWMIQVESGSLVETVFIPEKDRGTLCVSSQAGCSLNCSFCSTGRQGFNSNLTAAEIIGQLWLANNILYKNHQKKTRFITNVVMMGMGEPLMNFDPVVDAMCLMMDDFGYGLSKRRVTLSTSGVVPMIKKLATVTDVSLAISLHAPNNDLRNQLVPINKKYPLSDLLKAIDIYMNSLPDKRRVVTIEYTLIAGINDKLEHAKEMAELLRNTPCKINLIPFNSFPNSGYQRPSNNAVHRFQNYLYHAGYNANIRKTRGDEIDAACGQLVGKVEDRTKRSERYIRIMERQ